MNRYGKRCVLYPRVSTEMQVDGYSLEGQKNMLTRFADREEMIVVDTYEDAGKSGKSIEGRPAFQKMLRDIEDAKRLRTGVKQPSKIGRDRVHLLSGLLKCPVCGSPMYTNKHAWTNKDGTYKEIYYYVCSRNRMVRGKHCEYKAMLKKTDIEPMVIEAIREIVRNEEYAQAIKKRIGVQIDTKAVDKELEGYQVKLKEVDLNKTRLEREIDSLPADAKYRERKLHDMTLRLDSLYDVIVELEEKIEDARLRRDAIKQQAITLENIYKIMVNFDCVYNIINDEEKRNVVTALIKEIEIYRNDESEYPLKRIGLNFPVFKDGGEVTELLWDKGNTVETCVLLQRRTM